jgi:hypothetical protein
MFRWFLVFIGLLVAWQGAFALHRGRPFYPNYWGGAVFSWFAIAVGIVISAFALCIPGRLLKRESGRPAKVTPWDDFRKW